MEGVLVIFNFHFRCCLRHMVHCRDFNLARVPRCAVSENFTAYWPRGRVTSDDDFLQSKNNFLKLLSCSIVIGIAYSFYLRLIAACGRR